MWKSIKNALLNQHYSDWKIRLHCQCLCESVGLSLSENAISQAARSSVCLSEWVMERERDRRGKEEEVPVNITSFIPLLFASVPLLTLLLHELFLWPMTKEHTRRHTHFYDSQTNCVCPASHRCLGSSYCKCAGILDLCSLMLLKVVWVNEVQINKKQGEPVFNIDQRCMCWCKYIDAVHLWQCSLYPCWSVPPYTSLFLFFPLLLLPNQSRSSIIQQFAFSP